MDFLYLILYNLFRYLLCGIVVVALAYVPYMKFKNFCRIHFKNQYVQKILQGCFILFVLFILYVLVNLIT